MLVWLIIIVLLGKLRVFLYSLWPFLDFFLRGLHLVKVSIMWFLIPDYLILLFPIQSQSPTTKINTNYYYCTNQNYSCRKSHTFSKVPCLVIVPSMQSQFYKVIFILISLLLCSRLVFYTWRINMNRLKTTNWQNQNH